MRSVKRMRSGRTQFVADCHAVEGLPLNMIIVMTVLAITVPLIFGSLQAYDRGRIEASLASEIDNFIAMAQLIYVSGPGNSALIEFSAAGGSFSGIDSVTFGDAAGGNMASVIRYVVHNSPEQLILLSSPNVPMMSEELGAFEIQSGSYIILAECVSWSADLNGDGIGNDVFIRLSLVQ